MHLWILLSLNLVSASYWICVYSCKTFYNSKNKPNSSLFISFVLTFHPTGFIRAERSRGDKRRHCWRNRRLWEKLLFMLTCWLLLLQSDSRLQLRVNAGRNDGRRELSQVGQNTLTQGAHISLSQLALCTTSTFQKRWLITQGAAFIKSRNKDWSSVNVRLTRAQAVHCALGTWRVTCIVQGPGVQA